MPKKAAFFSIPISIDRQQPNPLWKQLYESLREMVLDGRLESGYRLPPTRSLAEELGIGRNTVNNAYDQLIAEGYLEARQGAGTFVTCQLPESFLRIRANQEKREVTYQSPLAAHPPLSQYGRELLNSSLDPTDDEGSPVPFRAGVPALDRFPHALWRKLIDQRWRTLSSNLLSYGQTTGYQPLREALANYLGPARGVRCTPEQIIITAGAQQAFTLAARVLLNPDNTVWIEEPGYINARNILAVNGSTLAFIPVDENGIDVAAGIQSAPDARMVYITPSHQYPTGSLMSLARRLALLDWARENKAWVIEDDYDSEYRYAGHPIAALQGLDTEGCVLYVGSFSKVLFPALRLGYLIVPPHLVEVFTKGRLALDHSPPLLTQAVTADFIIEGHFVRHIRQMRTVYAERQAALLEATQSLLGDIMTVEAKPAGLHAMAWLADGLDSADLSTRFAGAGIEAAPLTKYAATPLSRQGLVLGYGAYSPSQIWQAVRQMANVYC